MSNAKTPAKVLKTAYKRVTTRLGRDMWVRTDRDGTYKVCLEAALFGFCRTPTTQAQIEARDIVRQIIKERHPGTMVDLYGEISIPAFNDAKRHLANGDVEYIFSEEEIAEVVKLAWIRADSGGSIDPEEDYIGDEDLNDLLDFNSCERG